MALNALDITNGIVLIIFCLISVYVGIRIALGYFKFGDTQFLLIGIVWIILASPWYPATISFIKYLAVGSRLGEIPYFLIGVGFTPLGISLWMIAFTKFFYKDKIKYVYLIFSIYTVLFYIFFILLLIDDPANIGVLVGNTDVRYGLFFNLNAGLMLIIALVTGYIFYRESIKSENYEIRLKGKLLFIAFILFVLGAGYDTFDQLNFITLPILRGLEIMAALFFYSGFLLPNWLKKLLKNKNNN